MVRSSRIAPARSTTYGDAPVAPSSGPGDRSARRVLEARERPVALEPLGDGAVERHVELGAVGAHPGAHGGDVRLALERIDVEAADHVATARLADGIGEPAPLGEVARVTLEIGAVLLDGHLVRPFAADEARRGPDVLHRRRPRRVIARVVLGAERLELHAGRGEAARWLEVGGDESGVGHAATLVHGDAGAARARVP